MSDRQLFGESVKQTLGYAIDFRRQRQAHRRRRLVLRLTLSCVFTLIGSIVGAYFGARAAYLIMWHLR